MKRKNTNSYVKQGMPYLILFLVIVGVLDEFDDFSFLNPIKIYKTYHVNYFGAALICIIYNLMCPVGSIGYWIYKICTVGRKD